MHFLPEPTLARFTDDTMSVDLEDGRTITVPLAWYPRLLHASPEQRLAYDLSPGGIHWEAIDEDISVEGMLAGWSDLTRSPLKAA
jgi:hypothetical protein